eukprot:TRINITY_DN7048_c0_g1_i1.p1 TRINITY_DN7048_c0_g1~~TRINITY_DN7048_c0_g1_i1.p1  ORF type:complete len:578 (+),score=251.27 TRINITY_DN7048_c0_g1_i1:168-1901(+)
MLAVLMLHLVAACSSDDCVWGPTKPEAMQAPTRCGVTGRHGFINFDASVVSPMPVVYPKDDSELAAVLRTIHAHGCKARPVGATHTASAVITSTGETDTVGISLAEYTPVKGWDRVLLDTKTSRVRAPAGYSLFDLYQVIRPEGYFLPTQTAGQLFTLGGLVSNHVHGGVHGQGYVHQSVTALRVATFTRNATVEFTVVEGKALRPWRGSFGLLGLVTGVEFQVVHRKRFSLHTQTHSLAGDFSRETVDAYFKGVQEGSMSSENFFDPYSLSVMSVTWRKEADIPAECDAVRDADCTWDHYSMGCANPTCCGTRYEFGDLTPSHLCKALYHNPTPQEMREHYATLAPSFRSVRYNGAPAVPEGEGAKLVAAVKTIPSTHMMQRIFYAKTNSILSNGILVNSREMNDGFGIRAAPFALRMVAYAVPANKLFDMLQLIREVFASVREETGTAPLATTECRYINLTDVSTLRPNTALTKEAPVGTYVSCDNVFISFKDLGDTWRETLYRFEKGARAMNGFMQTGKSFCFDRDESGMARPYANQQCIKSIFNDRQKEEFAAYRKAYDPLKLFDGGAARQFF